MAATVQQPSPATAAPAPAGVPLAWIAVVFFASGVPALVYQLVWQRLLALHSGVGIYSVAMIVAAFMAGLGVGAALGGVLSARLSHVAALRAFAVVELGIGAFAAASVWLYYDVLYLHGAAVLTSGWQVALGHFLALLVPTSLMGMSLPLLVRAMITDPATAPRRIGLLYGVNGLGAAVGALLAPWWLVRQFGLAGAVHCGVVLNVAAGVAALALGALYAGRLRQTDAPHVAPSVEQGAARLPLAAWALLYAASGFCALGLEIVWFRLVDTAVKSTAFTFGTVLGVYLLGLSAGSTFGAALSARIRRPLEAFLACQALLALYTAALVCTVSSVSADSAGLAWYFNYWAGAEPFVPDAVWGGADFWPSLLRLYIVLPVVVLVVPTFLMGLSFAILQRAVQDEEQTSGRKVGLLQAANIAGSTAGSLVVGLVALQLFGTSGTLRLLTLLGACFALLGLRSAAWRPAFVGLTLLLLFAAWFLPAQRDLWGPLHGLPPSAEAHFAEDASGIVGLKYDGRTNIWNLFVNGKEHSQLPYRQSPFEGTHVVLGALPTIIHPDPKQIAVIGLGSGSTAWAAGCRPTVEELRVFEICSPELDLVSAIAAEKEFLDIQEFLADRRLKIEFVDGRNGVVAGETKYDIIEADATRPSSAYSGNLYSLDFFRQCAAKLKPGGLMCSWAPTLRSYATFCEAFPYVLALRDDLLIGSMQPLAIEPAAWLARLREPGTSAYLGPLNVRLINDIVQGVHQACPAEAAGVAVNRDLWPYDEFSHPGSYDPAFRQIEDAGREQNAPRVAELERQLTELAPHHPWSLRVRARALARRGQVDEAAALLDEALGLAPCFAQAQLDRAQVAFLQSGEAGSLAAWKRAAELLPCNAQTQVELGRRYAGQGATAEAVSHLERALVFDDGNWEAAWRLAQIRLTDDPQWHNAEDALRLARDASRLTRSSLVEVQETLADALAAAGHRDEAIKALEDLISQFTGADDAETRARLQRHLDDLRNRSR